MNFGWCKKRKINVNFDGGDITSDGGILLVKKIDTKINLTYRVAKKLNDPRNKNRCIHSTLEILRQLVYGLILGYEDLNDHTQLRNDKLIQTALGLDHQLASAPTLCRYENTIDETSLDEITKILIQIFIESHKEIPKELILDFDGTDDRVHGKQIGGVFNGYYKHKCYFPLYVFCGDQLLVACLRPGNVSDSEHSLPILKLLVKELRTHWPQVSIIFRADGAFCRHKMFDWCDENKVKYITGIPANNRLMNHAQKYVDNSNRLFKETDENQRIFGDFVYAAETWKKPRRVIVKAERNIHKSNTRFIVTNLYGYAKRLYEKIYCARGKMENRIKEQQLCLFADRTSSHKWLANQFRLLLSAMAYTLLEAMRRTALKGTEIAKAQCSTIRMRLLKIGAVITHNTRSVKVLLSSTYPWLYLKSSLIGCFLLEKLKINGHTQDFKILGIGVSQIQFLENNTIKLF